MAPLLSPIPLDAGGAILLLWPIWACIFMLAVFFLETFVLRRQISGSFLKLLGIVIVANIVSFGLGILFIAVTKFETIYPVLAFCYGITVFSEWVVLFLFLPQEEKKKLLISSIVMNLLSYLLLCLMASLLFMDF